MLLQSRLTALGSRLQGMKRNQSKPKATTNDHHHDLQLPLKLSDGIPQELFERVIDFLHDDKPSLSSCSLVCTAWFPSSHYHLFGSLLVCPIWFDYDWCMHKIKCATVLRGRDIFYGNKAGVYQASLEHNTVPVQVLSLPNISQIEVLEDHDILICLSGHTVMTVPLDALGQGSLKDASSCSKVASHVSFFKAGVLSGRMCICIVKSGALSTTFKVMQPVTPQPLDHFELELRTEFYIPQTATSVHFLTQDVVAGTDSGGFEVVDLGALSTVTLLPPSDPVPPLKKDSCLAACRVGEEVLTCYSTQAFYLDTNGNLSRDQPIQWKHSPIVAVAFRGVYILAFSRSHLEVWHIDNGTLLQTIRGTYRLLCTSLLSSLIRADDGKVIGLQFPDQQV